MVTRINRSTFTGSGKVFDGTLAAAVMSLAQGHARRVAASLSDITDNGGGTNDVGGLRDPGTFTPFEESGTASTAKAEFETAVGGVRDAIKEIVAQCNTIRAKVPAFDALTDSMGGTAADGTIAAIDDSMTAAAADLVAVDGANAVFATLNARMSQACFYVNKLRAACGMSAIASELDDYSGMSGTFAAVSTDTGTAVDGSDAEENATVSKAEADAKLDVMSDNIKTLSTALNAITADANANAALDVVAV